LPYFSQTHNLDSNKKDQKNGKGYLKNRKKEIYGLNLNCGKDSNSTTRLLEVVAAIRTMTSVVDR